MKKYYLLITVLSLLFLSCGNGNKKDSSVKTIKANTETAIAYNNEMVIFHAEIEGCMVAVYDAIYLSGYEDMIYAKKNALLTVSELRESVNNFEDFDGSDDFKKEMLSFIDTFEDILTNELSEIIEINGGTGAISSSEMDNYNELYASALDKYDIAYNKFELFQQNFAKKWDFPLE